MRRTVKMLVSTILVLALVVGCFAAMPIANVQAIGGFPGDSKPLPLLKNQAPVYKDKVATDLLEAVYNGNSASIPGWNKISGNGEKVNIMVNGVKVGYFVFDKKGNVADKGFTDFLKIEIYDNILELSGEATVNIRWHCSKYYAYADLSTPGEYWIPQLMQDNGKIQSFDQIWIGTSYTPYTPSEGTLSIIKMVNGERFGDWARGLPSERLGSIVAGMKFDLYTSNAKGETIQYLATGSMDETGKINFENKYPIGWYVITESVTGRALNYFETEADKTVVIYIDGVINGIANVIGESNNFDYNTGYTIVNGYGGGYVLGYPGLNNNGDIFYIGVTNTVTGEEYASFCANAGSVSFASAGYMIASKDKTLMDYISLLSAYNYIEDTYGNLNDLRPITQIITWHLLGAIDADNLDAINWDAVKAGTSAIKGIDNARTIVDDIIANYQGYGGDGTIVDVVYMISADPNEDVHTGQPQLVPVYGGEVSITNKPRESFTFDVTVYHRIVETGEYLVYPGVGEKFSNTDETYIEWLNDVNGFTFLNLYLAATRNNDPAAMESVKGYVCDHVTKNDPSDESFKLTPNGAGEQITALITPQAEGHYVITFWYEAESNDDGIIPTEVIYHSATKSGLSLSMQDGNNKGTLDVEINGMTYVIGSKAEPVKAQQGWISTFNVDGFRVTVKASGNSNKIVEVVVDATNPNVAVVIGKVSIGMVFQE